MLYSLSTVRGEEGVGTGKGGEGWRIGSYKLPRKGAERTSGLKHLSSRSIHSLIFSNRAYTRAIKVFVTACVCVLFEPYQAFWFTESCMFVAIIAGRGSRMMDVPGEPRAWHLCVGNVLDRGTTFFVLGVEVYHMQL